MTLKMSRKEGADSKRLLHIVQVRWTRHSEIIRSAASAKNSIVVLSASLDPDGAWCRSATAVCDHICALQVSRSDECARLNQQRLLLDVSCNGTILKANQGECDSQRARALVGLTVILHQKHCSQDTARA